jgi:hypothetical protein
MTNEARRNLVGTRRQTTPRRVGLAFRGICRASDDRRSPHRYDNTELRRRSSCWPQEGLPKDCVINCDWLVTLPKADLIERAGTLSASKLRALDDALRFALGLDSES